MKIRMKLKPFLGKRRTSLKKICERNNISSPEQLESFLDGLGVEPPTDEQTKGLFDSVPSKKQKRVAKPPGSTSAQVNRSRSKRKAKGTQRGVQSSAVKTESSE